MGIGYLISVGIQCPFCFYKGFIFTGSHFLGPDYFL